MNDPHLIYHVPQLIHPCGGYTDRNGITWQISGDFYAYPGDDINKLEDKYETWWPSVNSESMVNINYLSDPPSKHLAIGAMKEYTRLMGISRIKYVKWEDPEYPDLKDQIMVTREFL